ncbi:hypothetical protein QYE76_043733 [Lolium multiflorum]|uniref:Uncharacterized protein n=1 Tax=Lolium multiflorum TaxID=4521 RepID=A0AAD8THS6_LOLMU|nr:hypothetical protein QYE76_043733 [Lolium multiflorum]
MTIPRHLAPTVGPSASAAGVSIRTGLTTTTGERVASGLVGDSAPSMRRRALAASPTGHSCRRQHHRFGGFDVYVATVAPPRYRARSRCRRIRLGRKGAATTVPAGGSPGKAEHPAHAGADPTTIEKDLEEHRRLLLKQTEEPAAQSAVGDQREFNRAHGLTPAGDNPSRAGQIRRRGGALGAEIARDGAESPAPSAEQPVYNTPDKNMLAAEAAAEELRLGASYAASERVTSCRRRPTG